jgi:hypothetical protein
MTDITVTLAGTPYTIGQLTLGQLRDLSVGVVLPDGPDPQDTVRRSFDRSVSIIAVAVGEANPELTPAALYKMKITRAEMRDAFDAILRFAGMIPAGEAPPGEAGAVESTTATSSPA